MHRRNAAVVGDRFRFDGRPDALRVEALLEDDASPHIERGERQDLQPERMKERRDDEHPIRVLDAEIEFRISTIEEGLSMREECTFRVTRRSRRVHQDHGIIGSDRLAEIRRRRSGECVLVVIFARFALGRTLAAHPDPDFEQLRRRFAHDLVRGLGPLPPGSLHQNDVRRRIIELEGDLNGSQSRVHRENDRAEPSGREECFERRPPVAEPQRDPIAAADGVFSKPGGQALDSVFRASKITSALRIGPGERVGPIACPTRDPCAHVVFDGGGIVGNRAGDFRASARRHRGAENTERSSGRQRVGSGRRTLGPAGVTPARQAGFHRVAPAL